MGGIGMTHGVMNNLWRALESISEDSESQLSDLKEVVGSIRSVLVDAERNQESLSHEEQAYIQKLKDVVYDADDVVDEFLATDHQKQQDVSRSSRVRNFFFSSSSNPLSATYNMSQSVKNIRKKLDSIVSTRPVFVIDKMRRREETSSYLYAPNIIGREHDVEAIIEDMFTCEKDISFLPIVGIGGLGKTALAQLVYSDHRVVSEFPMRLWVCVADQSGDEFDLKAISAKILKSARGLPKELDHDESSAEDQVLQLFQGKKFLLVLDDVWSEDGNKWDKLKALVKVGGKGSRVLATTRSIQTARMAGDGHVYELKGLSEEASWSLFEMTAFDRGQELDSELVQLGRNIIAKCANVPLALKVTSSLLYGQERSKWLAFHQRGLDEISYHGANDIMSILKVSYYHLDAPLKCCFTFCALFPKDFEIRKELLISLWMAQGYIIVPPQGECTKEDVAEEYFSILLRRCFFQDVQKDEYGEVISCKIHDLMHDLAQQVAGIEIGVVKRLAGISEKTRHLFHDAKQDKETSFSKLNIRTYLQSGFHGQIPVSALLANCMCLRALALHNLDGNILPDSISKLIHLRYLDLSRNKGLETLPKSITKLCYLETLDLRDCSKLKELPSDLSKLVNLRRLDIFGCEALSHMPLHMNKLSCLCVLTQFVVNKGDSSGKLEDLRGLKNLKGCIEIVIPENYTTAEEHEMQGECLREMAHVMAVGIHFRGTGDVNRHSVLLEELQPHQNLKGLTLKGYQGAAIQWADWFGHLVKLELSSCERLLHLPFVNKLQNLKSLVLHNLINMEYMEHSAAPEQGTTEPEPESNAEPEPEFLPSLEFLEISGMRKLIGWWRTVQRRQSSFQRLSQLRIQSCPNLLSFPPCPNVEKLCLRDLNATLKLVELCPEFHIKLRELEVENFSDLKSLLSSLDRIHNSGEGLQSLLRSSEVLHHSINLRSLKIGGRPKRTHLRGGFVRSFTTSESVRGKTKVASDVQNDGDEPWKLLHQSLCSLELDCLENMMNLPKGMQHLTALQHLTINHCNNLKVIPEWISCLSSLESFSIRSCGGLKSLPEAMRKLTSLLRLEIESNMYLKERCRAPHGEDWPKIQHIPSISLH